MMHCKLFIRICGVVVVAAVATAAAVQMSLSVDRRGFPQAQDVVKSFVPTSLPTYLVCALAHAHASAGILPLLFYGTRSLSSEYASGRC